LLNFSTDDWLEKFMLHALSDNFSEQGFEGCVNFDVEKLALQLQQLMLKLIHIGLLETPVFSQCRKNLFDENTEKSQQEEF